MQIIDNRTNNYITTLDDIHRGECFINNNIVYMKTKQVDWSGLSETERKEYCICLRLDNGDLIKLHKTRPITRINIECNIID